jgi:MOSC domain-containing protein YiiM
MTASSTGTVVAVCRNPEPGIPKPVVDSIHLIEGLGIEGDYHAGKLVRHRYLARKYPNRPNNRQALLVDGAVFAELAQQNIQIGPGMMGENIVIRGIDLTKLAEGTRLAIGSALLEVTEVREPCKQLNGSHSRLLKAVIAKENGKTIYKAGIMTHILQGGEVRAGDQVSVVSELIPAVAQPTSDGSASSAR